MPKPDLYKYQRYVEAGPNGVALDFRNTDADADAEDAPRATYLDEVDGWRYVSVPDGAVMPEQPPEINWEQVASPSYELIERLKRSRPFAVAKGAVRESIEREVGDLHDLVADCMRLCEFSLALNLRVSNEVLAGTQMDATLRQAYTERVQTVLTAIDSGDVVMRSDIEDPVDMMMRLMARQTQLNVLMGEDYKPRVEDLLP